ncbi:MAG: carboxypeptidase-like regulatory domain-containing protein, partial [Flavobacteriales bacterium]
MTKFTLTLIAALGMYCTLQAQSLRGTISDAQGNPLPGASVVADGTNGQFADADGAYVLSLSPGTHTVQFSYIGYISQTKEVTMGNEDQTLNVSLADDAVLIEDVVVVGYGVQRKKEVTGSIVKVDSKQITGVQTPSFEAALQGQAAGVQVSQSSGVAGAPSLIRVRGVASVSAAGDPLYVVDGIPITQEYFLRGNSGALNNNPLAAINPNDIESVEILKDAAATGIYGSR